MNNNVEGKLLIIIAKIRGDSEEHLKSG